MALSLNSAAWCRMTQEPQHRLQPLRSMRVRACSKQQQTRSNSTGSSRCGRSRYEVSVVSMAASGCWRFRLRVDVISGKQIGPFAIAAQKPGNPACSASPAHRKDRLVRPEAASPFWALRMLSNSFSRAQ